MPVIIAIVLLTFVVRDGQLMACSGPVGWSRRLVLYIASFSLQSGLALVLFREFGTEEVAMRIRRPEVWVPCALLHAVIWAHVRRLRGSRDPVPAWTAALLPAPVLLLALVLPISFFSGNARGLEAIGTFLVFVAVWAAVVAALSRLWINAAPADEDTALEFSGLSNVLAVFLVPFELL